MLRQSTPRRFCPVSIVTGVGLVGGWVGSKVASPPPASTATHSVVDGQATARILRLLNTLSMAAGVGVPGEPGLNVTSWPLSSTALHWVCDGQATPLRMWPLSIA